MVGGGGLVATRPPAVGRMAPDFELSTIQGKTIRLSEMTGKGAVVLIVLRGYLDHNCPFCNLQLYDFTHNAQAFVQTTARVVLVLPRLSTRSKCTCGKVHGEQKFAKQF
jgi:thioredoxin-dependent peroxiredoxin